MILDTSTETHVLEGMAKALFVTWWSAWAERRTEVTGERPPWSGGDELTEVMPDLPKDAMVKAAYLAGQIASLNGESLFFVCYHAAQKDGHTAPNEDEACGPDYWESMGHYMAMEALGHGVAWSDDHVDPEWKMPFHTEVDFYDPIRFPEPIAVGERVIVPEPEENDPWAEAFVATLDFYEKGRAVVYDYDGNSFDIEIGRLKIHNDD